MCCQKPFANSSKNVQRPSKKNHSLFKYKQVVFTPHQAGLSQESAERMSIKSIQNILDYFDGTLDESLVVNGVHL